MAFFILLLDVKRFKLVMSMLVESRGCSIPTVWWSSEENEKKKKTFESCAQVSGVHIFFESPHRILDTAESRFLEVVDTILTRPNHPKCG